MKKNAFILFVVLLCNSAFIHSSANAINIFRSRFYQFLPQVYGTIGSLIMAKLTYDNKIEAKLATGTCAFLLLTVISYILPIPKGFHCCHGFCHSCPNVNMIKEESIFYMCSYPAKL